MKTIKKYFLIIFLLFFTIHTLKSQIVNDNFMLQNGDLLFQNLDCGDFCIAVEKVTKGYRGARFSHCGMVVLDTMGAKVIEAISKGVSITPLNDFLIRSFDKNNKPKVVVGRLNSAYQYLVPKAVKEAYMLVGSPYDDVFCITNDSYYCSELIYDIFKKANNGKEVFTLVPMTFKDPDPKETFPIWAKYFNDLNKPIPEGEPGNNPGGLSLSRKISIVHAYGIPNGWKEN